MEKNRYFNSALNDKEFRKIDYNDKNKRNSFNLHNLLNQQKNNIKRRSCELLKSSFPSTLEYKISKNDTYNPKFIHEQVKQYEKHPFRKPNLKIVGEDIKYRLIEMNEKDNKEKYKENKEKEIKNSYLKELNVIPDKDIEKVDENENKIISLKIPKKKKRKIKKNIKKNLNPKLLIKYRKLLRIKNLYDSNNDDESDEEQKEDEYVINPEIKIITFFDLLMIIFFLINFNISTFNLCQSKCFCSSDKIIFSDILLFINDILCILDLIISFFRAYYNFEYKLIKSNSLIVIHYLKYDFIFDLLSAIPIFTINKYICLHKINNFQCFKYQMSGTFIFLKLCSVLKVLKINKIINQKKNQAMEKFFELISDSYTLEKTITILIYALIYIGILHCIVCIHIFLGKNSYSNWLILTKAENDSFHEVYIKSLYFIITTLTTIGYGDIVCQSLIERIFQIIILAIGSIFYPYLVSSIGNLIKKDTNAQIKHNNNFSMLEKIRKDYPNIPFKLYNNIYKYLEKKGCSLEKYDVNSFIESLPISLKNNILFTMYKNLILDFKFFKRNNNSVFIAEVLNNIIPSVSKKNEFLIYEGEMIEEIIFVKDGKISLNAAVNTENPSKSLEKYFLENFTPFTTDEEKKLINENMNNKSFVSTLGELTYDKAKSKLNNAFKTIKAEKITEEKNQFQLHSVINKNDYFDFDIKGGAIINDEGNYQYLKIIDIRKNDHFGCVFMTLKKPCPLSLQVKSKIAELFLLKKEQAINLSKSYPNIWKKIYEREFHNMRSIKNATFSILKKYIEINELLLNQNINDILKTNEITINDLNFLEMSALGDISPRRSKILQNKTLNYNSKNKKIDLKVVHTNLKEKVKKSMRVRRNSTFSGNNIKLLANKQFDKSNIDESNKKSNFISISILKSNIIKSDINKEKENSNINFDNKNKQKRNKEKLKNLKQFLINSKKYFINNNYIKQTDLNTINNNENNDFPKHVLSGKKNCFKKKILPPEEIEQNNKNLINSQILSSSNKKKVEFNLNLEKENNLNKFINGDQVLKDLKNICEEENNFSFCSTCNCENNNSELFSIEYNSNFEILSSYQNLNNLSKGNYIKDHNFQKKIKTILTSHYLNKNKETDLNESLSLRTIALSSAIDKNNHSIKKNGSQNPINKNNSKKFKIIKRKELNKNNSSNISNESNQKHSYKKRDNKIINKTWVKQKNSLNSKKISNSSIKNNIKDSKKNFELFSTFKLPKKNLFVEAKSEIFDSNIIKPSNNTSSSFSKNAISKKVNSSVDSSIRKELSSYKSKEVEFVFDKGKYKKISDKNLILDNNPFMNNTNYKIYKNNKKKFYHNNESIYNDKNKKLINQMLGIQIPNTNIINKNIITTSSNLNEQKENFNSVDKIKNIEASLNIYNIVQKNINKNLNIIDNNEKTNREKWTSTFCCII